MEAVFSTRSVQRCYKQGQLLLKAGSWGREPFGNPQEGERTQLKVATKQRLVKTVTDWEDLVCPVVVYELWRAVKA
jgi:hypothetical protein